MSRETSDAIVLKTVEFSESSLIVTLFTKNVGKISGIAKGGKRLKNPFESALDPLAQICVSFIRKNSDALDLLTEAKLWSRFRPNAQNLSGLSAGYYLVELLDRMTPDGLASPELYTVAAETLNVLQTGETLAEAMHRYEWALLRYSGEEPSLRGCVSCGAAIPLEQLAAANEQIAFGFLDGGVICATCRRDHGFRQVTSVSAQAILWLDRLDQTGRATPFVESDQKIAGEIRGLLDYYFCTLLGFKPKTQNWG